MPRDLLLELGLEEVPASELSKAIESWPAAATSALEIARLSHQSITAMGTPRRLTLCVSSLSDRQSDLSEDMVGPPARIAYDGEGKLTKAGEAFAKRNQVEPRELRRGEVEGKKGEYLLCTRKEEGKAALEVLPELLQELISGLSWKKSMRWHAMDESFVRPLHWIVAVLGDEVIPLSFAGICSGRESRGHRFLAPGAITLGADKEAYLGAMREAFVVASPERRKTMIAAELERVEKEMSARVRLDEELIAEVANLVEYPVAIAGKFPEDFLDVPERVIVSAMRSHQRYFAVEDDAGALLNRFVTIAGTVTKSPDLVRAGNERVLAARLADAQFFFREDQKHSLDDFAARLRDVVFQKKLGSIGDKVERMRAFCARFADAFDVDTTLADRAAQLCKADLCSQMVYEFPELQGTMGKRFATLAGEDPAVAAAMEGHYLPRGAGDEVPESTLSALVGIADRIDTMSGCFAIGVVPTGSADPFGLRRAAIGLLRLALSMNEPADLEAWVEAALTEHQKNGLAFDAGKVRAEVLEFLRVRFRGLLSESLELPIDCVDAALATDFRDPKDAYQRARAVTRLRERSDFVDLAAAFKRVANILKGQSSDAVPNPERFVVDDETQLWTSFEGIEARAQGKVDDADYEGALAILSELRSPVDQFFESVLVMDKDEAVRENRLAVLGRINRAFRQIADFRQLAV